MSRHFNLTFSDRHLCVQQLIQEKQWIESWSAHQFLSKSSRCITICPKVASLVVVLNRLMAERQPGFYWICNRRVLRLLCRLLSSLSC